MSLVGREGFVFLHEQGGTRSRSGERRTLVGAARVRIDAIDGGQLDVTLLAVSGPFEPGRRMRFTRTEVSVTREERECFAANVRRFWPSREDTDTRGKKAMTKKELMKAIQNIIANPARWEAYFGANVTRMLGAKQVGDFSRDTMTQIVQVLLSNEMVVLKDE